MPKKIAVAMSGGVDSSLTAALLQEKGYQVIGFYFHLYKEPHPAATQPRSARYQSRLARLTAKNLNIPLHQINLTKEFQKKVVNKVLDKYKRGLVPNPCILCNKFVRLKKGLEFAQKHQCHALATGHYARIINNQLYQAADLSKDQSYFLYFLKQEQLKNLQFPLGNWKKADVWHEAEKRKLPAAKSKESFDLCFTCNICKFLDKNLKEHIKPGLVVNVKGDELGKHRGLALYTIGYRGGWDWSPQAQKKFSKSGQLPKLYVAKKDISKNALIVGNKKEASKKEFKVKIDHWKELSQDKLYVKIRSMGKMLSVNQVEKFNSLKVTLKSPQLGITPGQYAVFYGKNRDGYFVVAGGEITI
jgi:tRNA-specific 2-thiouridylase